MLRGEAEAGLEHVREAVLSGDADALRYRRHGEACLCEKALGLFHAVVFDSAAYGLSFHLAESQFREPSRHAEVS